MPISSMHLGSFMKPHVKDLGLVLDSEIKMDKQINTLVRS